MSGPLFRPFRALGYITDDAPFAVQRRGKETYVTVSVGRTWQVYNCSKLTLVLAGPQLSGTLRALACKGDLTFAAVGSTVTECKRVHKSGEYGGQHSGPITSLMVLGDLLLGLGADGELVVWRIGEYDEPQAVMQLDASFRPTCMVHPDTYVNKVVLGSEDGRLQLWNFATSTLLYTFAGWGSPVRCLAPAPALDTVGVGLADGRAVVHNLRYDESVVEFHNAAGAGAAAHLGAAALPAVRAAGAVTALAFRSGVGLPLLAAGVGGGAVTVWDLEGRKLQCTLRAAHDAPIQALHFFAGEPLLMSAGGDNALKQWVFDAADGGGRLLRFRSGHAAPPTVVTHYGQGLRLLSAGQDRALRCFSTIQDQQSRELSQKTGAGRGAKRLKGGAAPGEELRLGRVTALDANEVHERDWCNVVTAHEGDTAAYTWRLAHFALGEAVLRPPAAALGGTQPGVVTAMALSACGNFAVVGSAVGRVDRYNMQSGLHRGVYARRQAASGVDGGADVPAHDGPVTGIGVAATNRLLVTVGHDGFLRTWDFKKQTMVQAIDVGSPIERMALHAASGLAALDVSGGALRVYDTEAGRLVRRFNGHRDRVTHLAISADCRWLLSSSMDGTLRVWDIPAAQCLQALRLGSPVTSFSLSPTADLLATTHTDKRGVFLWSNQLLFGDPSQVAAYTGGEVAVQLPSITSGRPRRQHDKGGGAGASGASDSDASWDVSEGGDSDERASSSGDDDDDEGAGQRQQDGPGLERAAVGAAAAAASARDAAGAPVPLTPELATLALLPRTQWETLLHLEVIQARSRPVQPPKKPEAAPFFLPSVATLEGRPVFDGVTAAAAAAAAAANRGSGSGAQGGGLPGWDSEEERDDAGGADAPAPSSRVLRAQPVGDGALSGAPGAPAGVDAFLRLLRAGHAAGDFSSFMAAARGMSAAALDRELRALTLRGDGQTEGEVADLEALLLCLEGEVAANRNFEFCAALVQHVLGVHGDAIVASPRLRDAAERLRERVAASWRRVGDLLHNVRCMIDLYSGVQG